MLENAIYTYNQGPVLGALLELGGTANLARVRCAAARSDGRSAAATSTLPGPADAGTGSATVLRCDGTGDGGLFTGILARYLALAARDGRLPGGDPGHRRAPGTDTAEAFWAGRRSIPPSEALAKHGQPDSLVFSSEPALPASRTYPPGAAVELSTQLQAWMVLEAAARRRSQPAAGQTAPSSAPPELRRTCNPAITSRNSSVIDVILIT